MGTIEVWGGKVCSRCAEALTKLKEAGYEVVERDFDEELIGEPMDKRDDIMIQCQLQDGVFPVLWYNGITSLDSILNGG